MRDILDKSRFLLLLALALVSITVCSYWVSTSGGIARADEITIRRDDGTEETFRLSRDFIDKATMMVVRFSPFILPAWEGKVVEITRADEIRVMKNDLTIENVRLYGIDGPIEPNRFGKEAAAYTAKLVLGKIVKVQPLLLPDPWSRTIAWVWINGESVNEELLKRGMVWWYRKYVPWETGLARLEAEAREARVGLWALPSPVPPWEEQAIPAGQPAGPDTDDSAGRRGSVREKVISEVGTARPLFGASGSVRDRLMKSKSTEDQEPASDSPDPAPQADSGR